MELSLIKKLITHPSSETNQLLFDDASEVFWVDWREEDASIIEYCESILKTEQLSSQFDDEKFLIHFGTLVKEVPLSMSGADRHITLLALNEILHPHFEIRMAWASNGSDTLAFAPLPCEVWNALELEFGVASVAQAFLKLTPYPNVFTDPLTSTPVQTASEKKWWEFWK